MHRRFEVAALLIVAPAGFGKTTLLSQALAAAADDPTRIDVWVQCEVRHADAELLGAALLRAAGATDEEQGSADADRIADALGHFAPAEVCMVLDDVHLIAESSAGLALLEALLERLPHNAHLVLAGRSRPSLRLARLQLQGRLESLSTAELQFDDDELGALGESSSAGDADAVARWPALVALSTSGEQGATVDYLLQEVATNLGGERTSAIAALALVDEIDDAAALAATDGALAAGPLLDDLPLVHRSERGTYRLHDLWREALVPDDREPLPPGTAAAVRRLAELRLADDASAAAALFARTGDRRGVEQAASTFAAKPYVATSVAELRAVHQLALTHLGDHPLTDLLDATFVARGDEHSSAAAFEAVAQRARAAGDAEIEGLAIGAAINMWVIIDPDRVPAWLGERAAALALAGHERARVSSAIQRAHAARSAGDPETAISALAEMTPLRDEYEIIYYAFTMSDLARPEFVDAPIDSRVTTETVTRAGGQYLAQALWLRGEVPPALGLELGRELAHASDGQRVPHVQISTNAVLAFVALAAGDSDEARRFADTAMQATARTSSTLAHAFAGWADAACVLVDQGEDAARPLVGRVLDLLPVGRWIPRPYLYSLPMLYLLAPSTRGTVDSCALGPSFALVAAAARALVALRDRGDPSPALSMLWDRPMLLQSHVLPPHLAELAAAAGAAGDGRVDPVLQDLPRQRDLLERAAASAPPAVADWARARVERLPARPTYDLRINLLGGVELVRDRTVVADPLWTGRERVRQLLCHLVLHRSVSRRRIATDLWPELAVDKALANLRVNLTHLQRVLQPDRERSTPAWFVRVGGDIISIESTTLRDDVREFEDDCRIGRASDEGSRTSTAIEAYARAIDRYRGPYLQEWPDLDWAEAERLRLHALAIGARCRLGELLLARGEPEQSAAHATAVLRDEPLQERAACLLVHALVAQGDRASARRAMETTLARLADHQLTPERTTEQLGRRLGIGLVDET